MEPLDPVLDSEQLVRIEATHRGFTYQNLYGVACLLTMNATGTISVIFEHDEDVELLRADTHIYLQIKTRQNSLVLSDISSTLDRFAQIRNEHTLGNRKRNAEFAIISNVKPGPELHRMLATESWPSDVAILWPGVYDDGAHLSLPPVSADLDTAYSSCVKLANNIPFRSLSPATLVLKLAGLAQRFSAGHNNHRANLDDVKGYLEQLVVQLQDFPSAPKIYMPQRGEPEMATLERIRLLVGPSGSGKTSWASQIARLSTRESTYLSVGEMPESAVSSTLARELAARFEFELEFRGIGLASTATGIELLKFIDKQVARSRRDITIVLDDTHQLQTGTVRSIIEALSGVNFILLAQPWTGMSELEVRLNIKAEMFRGWSLDSIAAAFARAGCAINAGHAARVIEITGGAPLYVLNGAQLTAEAYHGDVDEFISAIESRRNITKSAQEVILSEVFEKLSPASKTVAALLSLASVPLFADEIHELTAIESQSADLTASAIRDLTSRGLASASIDGSVKLHDAYRIVAVDSQSADSSRKLQDARVKLADIIEKSLPSRGNAGRFSLWIKLLSQTGRIENLINIAVQEFFHEAGDQRGVWSAIEAAAEQDDLTPEVRFWAFDAMVKWLHRDGRYDAIPPLVHRMSEIAEASGSSIEHNAFSVPTQ
ncbi:dsDNA nuclease domain-containing protein [Amycolatopsis circi]|uniref:dsDNA nuclease domain-containing protein n=1 Tax=Amycolatopsis circi TaxID=871959 RepID=UPI0013BE8C9C|nr:dsDNA nuclease domain-containing protein [Amycolatopsis circi]